MSTVNFSELDKKLVKITKIFEKEGFSCSYASDKKVYLVDNGMSSTTTDGKIGMIMVHNDTSVTVKLTGNMHTRKLAQEKTFKPNTFLLEVGAETRIMIRRYKEALKKLAD